MLTVLEWRVNRIVLKLAVKNMRVIVKMKIPVYLA